jgi:regulator of protease activity HflC (stomatin/prohibitin superfamily)
MDSALAWVGQIAEWLGRFVPRLLLLNTTEGAVKFVRGSRPVLLTPGLHFYWPLVTEVKAWVVARQSVNLPTQTVTTRDGKVIAVGGLLIFRIEDAMPLIAHTWNADQTIRDISAGVFHAVCSQAEWGELQMASHDGTLNRTLKKELRRRLSRFGVRVLDALLTDLAPCRVLKVIQTTSQDAS